MPSHRYLMTMFLLIEDTNSKDIFQNYFNPNISAELSMLMLCSFWCLFSFQDLLIEMKKKTKKNKKKPRKSSYNLCKPVLYNYGMFLFFKIIFVNYILSFGLVGLGTIRLSAGVHIEYSSRSCAEDMTITNDIINTPHRKWDWGANDVMLGSDGLRSVSWDLTRGETSLARGYGMRGAFVGSVSWDSTLGRGSPAEELTLGDVGSVSIVKIVCLSLLGSKE